jgi:hypothetical protein
MNAMIAFKVCFSVFVNKNFIPVNILSPPQLLDIYCTTTPFIFLNTLT